MRIFPKHDILLWLTSLITHFFNILMAILKQPPILICMSALQIFESFCPSDFGARMDNDNGGLLIFF